jgi:hypothetical protein
MIDTKIDLSGNDEESEDKDSLYELANSPHKVDIRTQVVECMEAFFADKKYWAGGKIAPKKLYTEENIITVMQTNILDALDVAYECLLEQKPQSHKITDDDGEEMKGWDIVLCYEILKSCPRRMIPKCFAGGILLVYLALCQGVNYIDKLKEHNTTLKGHYNSTI